MRGIGVTRGELVLHGGIYFMVTNKWINEKQKQHIVILYFIDLPNAPEAVTMCKK